MKALKRKTFTFSPWDSFDQRFGSGQKLHPVGTDWFFYVVPRSLAQTFLCIYPIVSTALSSEPFSCQGVKTMVSEIHVDKLASHSVGGRMHEIPDHRQAERFRLLFCRSSGFQISTNDCRRDRTGSWDQGSCLCRLSARLCHCQCFWRPKCHEMDNPFKTCGLPILAKHRILLSVVFAFQRFSNWRRFPWIWLVHSWKCARQHISCSGNWIQQFWHQIDGNKMFIYLGSCTKELWIIPPFPSSLTLLTSSQTSSIISDACSFLRFAQEEPIQSKLSNTLDKRSSSPKLSRNQQSSSGTFLLVPRAGKRSSSDTILRWLITQDSTQGFGGRKSKNLTLPSFATIWKNSESVYHHAGST